MQHQDNIAYITEFVRRYDYPRFCTVLFAPASARSALLSLLAFNIEIARVPDTASEPITAAIRLQWWRDALQEIERGVKVREHAVVEELAALHAAGRLDFASLHSMIEARADEAEQVIDWSNRQQVEHFIAHTAGALNHAMAAVQCAEDTPAMVGIGLAYGASGLMMQALLSGDEMRAAQLRSWCREWLEQAYKKAAGLDKAQRYLLLQINLSAFNDSVCSCYSGNLAAIANKAQSRMLPCYMSWWSIKNALTRR
ncbi:MAG: hypothetical protein CMM94_01525 [Rickettsiales bacterium]|nr:hypothetical protein [Rickettsiales bacterium]